ncbi:MAG: hypothetical protein KatS3mg131_0471 [Candidatus Tectimicrobiota bacterium]|nr:MAG: hypothetical protein KatS3mg131_0471 [Candidatus Tectomicrobia bacterium]
MQLLRKEDIYPKEVYERLRPEWRRRIMVEKQKRRVSVGDHCTVHFENRDTMHYQVQEMLRAENSWDKPGAIEAELEAYNPIIPRRGELSATLMFEYEDRAERDAALRKLVGIEDHVWLQIDDTPPIRAQFDRLQLDPQRISSVQYIKWHLSDEQRRLLKQEGTVVRIRIDHPAYSAQAVLSEETRRAIMNDPD